MAFVVLTITGACGALAAAWGAFRIRSAHRQFLQERSLFLAATESTLDAFFIFDCVRDPQGRIVDFAFRYLNPGAAGRLGRNLDTLLGKHLCAEYPLIISPKLFDSYCQIVETGIPRRLEFPVADPALAATWLRHHAVKLGDGIALTSTDLTELKSIETQFREMAKFSNSIFENAPFSIISTDADGIITAMNLQAETMTGYAREELIGKHSLLSLHDPQELRQRAQQVSHELEAPISEFDLITLHQAAGEGEAEWTYIRRDGTRSPVSLALKVLHSDSGERSGMIGIAQDVSSRRKMMSYVTHMMSRDPLTGLVGRYLLEDRILQAIERAKRNATKVVAFLIDLDSFKRINDSFGHRVGDEILTLAAARLIETVRSSDTVARTGGDEFVVVMPDLKELTAIEGCAERLIRAISEPYIIQQHTVQLTASAGYCVFPDLAASFDHLLERTGSAMHAAKQRGRNRCQVFTADMLQDASPRLSMESALRLALDHRELFLHYQPQVSLPTGRVIGIEALLRWNHPTLGLVSPAHFIPMAEEIGLMPEFGAWVIEQACRDARQLQDRMGRSFLLSVNISPRQFQQKRLVKTIEDALKASGLSAHNLEIEITENTLMINSTANLEMLQAIRDLGVRLSIDDFGTGFSSFSYLLQYQIDRLKIDQSFVRQAVVDANAAAVVRTIIAMSHGLDIKVIAEGAETREQVKFLLRRRCDEVQGFYFARPVACHELVETIERIETMDTEEIAAELGIGVELPATGPEAFQELDEVFDLPLGSA
ncbi:MAG TPA: EAL domain-containing protein [Granulicella sp.]|jgi:diguanylate cyclase (GGDEF)-like protein/PAS domain S-box-containing protein|nr:EAL domain-containing protein [Granulicella sp.]